MNTKNEVFEYLIDQLRQQLPVADVMGEIRRWSIDRSIAGRGNYTEEENAIIDAYIGRGHNPYKQQCEDLAREAQSLKNQLRDASSQIKELHLGLGKATGGVEDYKLIRKGGFIPKGKSYVVGEHGPGASVNCRCTQTPVPPEQSGCRKDDTQECEHEWCVETFYGTRVPPMYCRKCGQSNDQHPLYLGAVCRPDAPRGIRNVLFDGGVPVSSTRCRERALPVPGRQAH